MKWEDRKEEQKKTIVSNFNYAANGFLLSFPFYFIISIWLPHSVGRFLVTAISLSILFPYFEYYYKWFRAGWKD